MTKRIRAVFFPREEVPLAVNPHYGASHTSLSTLSDEWRETDRYMRTPEFARVMTRPKKWTRRNMTWALVERENDEEVRNGGY